MNFKILRAVYDNQTVKNLLAKIYSVNTRLNLKFRFVGQKISI